MKQVDLLLKDIAAFCEKHKMAETRFGIESINDGRLIPRMREGRSPRLDTAERVCDFMASYASLAEQKKKEGAQ